MNLPRKTCTVSTYNRSFGEAYRNILAAIAFSTNNNHIFLPTPFNTTVAHGQDGTSLTKFIGFEGYSRPTQVDIYTSSIRNPLCTNNPESLWTPEALRVMREFYYKEKKCAKCPYDIAIHIRRGDVNPVDWPSRFTSNAAYREIILLLKKKYPEYSIGIYSEGDLADFKYFKDLGVSFQLNTPLEEVFHHFVTAKILVIAKSSLSFSAAILSENTIYCIPIKYSCFALPKWNIFFTEGAVPQRPYNSRIKDGEGIYYLSETL